MLEIIKVLTDPEHLLNFITNVLSGWWSYVVLFAVIFAETGLLMGFFLPGDSLLFTVGVVAGAGDLNLLFILVVLLAAAIIGDNVGYMLGQRLGPRIFIKEESWFFKREYIARTQAFFEKYGSKTIIIARFVPIVRTFAPFMAGVGKMKRSEFIFYNVIGGFIWVISITLAGYFLGNVAVVRANFEKVVVLIILVSFLPTFWEVGKHYFNRRDFTQK